MHVPLSLLVVTLTPPLTYFGIYGPFVYVEEATGWQRAVWQARGAVRKSAAVWTAVSVYDWWATYQKEVAGKVLSNKLPPSPDVNHRLCFAPTKKRKNRSK